jgi:hypothetical protein
MSPYEIRMRCLEAAKPVTGDAYSALRCAFAFENYVTYGFHSGIGTLDAVTQPGERGETPPNPAAGTKPNSEAQMRADGVVLSGPLV